ncbi:MAG: CARDB domain-containing protein [Candidatus Promineifilaceae bacterium]|nr:CARDB domain-containing protein [Candidatus Promineifilaceae bacterium]
MRRKAFLLFPFLTLLLLLALFALMAGTPQPAAAQTGDPADLRIVKFSSPTNEVRAGEQFTYTIIVDNLGPYTATNIVITDTLVTSAAVDPNGCSIAIRTGGGAIDEFNCNFALSTGVFDLGTFGANHLYPRSPSDQGRIIVTINATAENATDMSNIATVVSDTPDPNMENNTAVTTLSVTNEADLRILKFSSPTNEVQAGQQFTYTIIVDNLGPVTADNIVITDTLVTSAGVDANGCSIAIRTAGGAIDEFDCNFALSTGVFDLGTFGSNHLNPRSPGDQGRIIITINATAENATDMSNITTVVSDTPDPNMENNTAVTTLSVIDVSDLAVSKQASATLVNAGEPISWTVTVTNTGPSRAENVSVTDNLPGALVEGSVEASGATCIPGTPGNPLAPMTCNLGYLAAGDSTTITITGQVDAAFHANQPNSTGSAAITNDVRTDSDVLDPNTSNNLASSTIEVTEAADLDLSTFAIGTVRAGETFHYEYDISNVGPSVARDVSLRDFLPDEVEFVSAFVDTEGGTGGEPLPCSITVGSNALFCPLGDVTLTDGVPILVFVNVRVRPDVPDGTSITNSADVFLSDTPDPNTTNNSDSATRTVVAEADLAIEKSVSDPTPAAGEELTYEITVTNNGPAYAADAVITDTLPPGVTYVLDTLNCGASLAGCTVGNLAPGASHTFNIVAEVDADATPGATLTNEVEVSSATPDPDTGNNTAAAGVSVEAIADLRVLKFGKPDGQVRAGESLTYTVLVDNFGPSFAHDVVLTDLLQSDGSFDLVAVSSDRSASCTPTSGSFNESLTISCSLSAPLEVMAATASGRWTLTVTIRANEAQSVNNVAQVTSSADDPDLENNTATVSHDVNDVADLSLQKSAVGQVQVDGEPGGTFAVTDGEVTAGALVTYTIAVTNAGPSVAENVLLRDPLPSGLNVLATEASHGQCTAGQTVTCGLGTLSAGEHVTISVVARAAAWLPDRAVLNNQALVSSDVFDTDNGLNRDTAPVMVHEAADLWIEMSQTPETIAEGEITYIIMVGNDGPSDASFALVRDIPPAGVTAVTWECVAVGEASCAPSGSDLLLTTVDLPAGSVVIFTMRGTIPQPQRVVNTATVEKATGSADPYLANNRATVTNLLMVNLPVIWK